MALHTFVAGEELTAAQLNDSFASRVATTGDETIAGVKTFSSAPKSSVAASASGELVRYDEAVLNTGNQTIAGIKTFSSIPVGPASDPTTDNQLARKAYVDNYRRLEYIAISQSGEFSAGDTSGWQEIDVSSVVPATAKVIECFVTLSSSFNAGLRKYGSGVSRWLPKTDAKVTFLVEGDPSQKVEAYGSIDIHTTFRVTGYWKQV